MAYAHATDVGRRRLLNEDRVATFPELGLAVVADGVGGNPAGEVAAQMAIDRVQHALVDFEACEPRGRVVRSLLETLRLDTAIKRANYAIYEAAESAPAWRGMGTTIAAMLAYSNGAVVAHVGDSRILRWRKRRIERLTEDHTLGNALVQAGLATPEQAGASAERHLLTRALGLEPAVDVDTRWVDLAPGDILVLHSDGLTATMNEDEIADVLLNLSDLDDAARQLVAQANDRGGPDNISIALARWELVGNPTDLDAQMRRPR